MAPHAVPDLAEVQARLGAVQGFIDGDESRAGVADAVRASARYLAAIAPGGAVEVRVPPYVAVQCIEGLTHKRGTPPNVVELDPRTWLELVTGRTRWADALDAGRIAVSGSRADLSAYLPLV